MAESSCCRGGAAVFSLIGKHLHCFSEPEKRFDGVRELSDVSFTQVSIFFGPWTIG
jgi:hypothetical protein